MTSDSPDMLVSIAVSSCVGPKSDIDKVLSSRLGRAQDFVCPDTSGARIVQYFLNAKDFDTYEYQELYNALNRTAGKTLYRFLNIPIYHDANTGLPDSIADQAIKTTINKGTRAGASFILSRGVISFSMAIGTYAYT